MGSSRRSFLKNMAVGTGVIAAAPLTGCKTGSDEKEAVAYIRENAERVPKMEFNMCGYAAPK